MKKRFSLFFAIILLLANTAFAKVQVRATLSYDSITLEDEAQIIVSVQGGNSSEPVAPRVPGLDIVQTGQRSQFTIVNGKMNSNVEYVFDVVPSDRGDYIIPGFVVYSEGQEYKSDELKLTVTGANYAQPPTKSLPPQSSKTNPPDVDEKIQNQVQQKMQNATNNSSPFWLSTSVSQLNPFVSQQILFHLKLFSRIGVNINGIDMPDFHDFYAQAVIDEKKGRETINGQSYITYEIIYALHPLKSGNLKIEKSVVSLSYRENEANQTGGWDPFFNLGRTVKKNLTAPEIELQVRDLPKPKPRDFSGLVGEFKIESQLDNKPIQLGDSLDLQITIAGYGNLRDMELPDWQINNFKIYKDKPLTDTQVGEQGAFTTKSWHVALVPTQVGQSQLPPMTLSYFDPQKESYETLQVDSVELQVLGDDQKKPEATFAAAPAPSNVVDVEQKNIFGVFEDAEAALAFKSFSCPFWLFVALTLGLPSLILVWPLSRRVSAKFQSHGSQKKQLKRALNELHQAVSQNSLENAQKSARGVLSILLQSHVNFKTATEIAIVLQQAGFWGPEAERVVQKLEFFEMQSYGFAKNQVDAKALKDLQASVEVLCKRHG